MKKYAILAIVLAVIIGGSIAYYQFSKTHEEMSAQDTFETLSSDELFSAFNSNEAEATQKYGGKVLEIYGDVYSVEEGNNEDMNILFMSEGEMFGVSCNFKKSDLKQIPQAGESITIKGECTGMLSDVIIIRCIILN